jgi:hypothetical protein
VESSRNRWDSAAIQKLHQNQQSKYVLSKIGVWVARMNNTSYGPAVATNVGFNNNHNNPRLGWGGSGSNSNFRGYISEVMIFDRELTADERATVSTGYLYKRYSLP